MTPQKKRSRTSKNGHRSPGTGIGRRIREALPARPAKDRSFLSDEGLRNVVRDGQKGVQVKVRLTSYRSLPLSCIEGIQLSIDGQPVDPRDIVFTLDNHSYKLDELPRLSKIWWFILDHAQLFVPRETELPSGEHEVEGTLVTVEPYMTAGRFSFFNTSRKQLCLETEL